MTSSPTGGAFSAPGLTQCATELSSTAAAAPGSVAQGQQDCCYTDWAGCNSTLRNIEGELHTDKGIWRVRGLEKHLKRIIQGLST